MHNIGNNFVKSTWPQNSYQQICDEVDGEYSRLTIPSCGGDDKRALKLLFEEEGWSKEGSPGYYEFASSALQEMAHLAELNGIAVLRGMENRLRQNAEANWKMLAPDGEFPTFGDHVPMSLYSEFTGVERPDFLPSIVLRRHAARFDLPEAKFVVEAFTPQWQAPHGILPDNGEELLARCESCACKSFPQ